MLQNPRLSRSEQALANKLTARVLVGKARDFIGEGTWRINRDKVYVKRA